MHINKQPVNGDTFCYICCTVLNVNKAPTNESSAKKTLFKTGDIM